MKRFSFIILVAAIAAAPTAAFGWIRIYGEDGRSEEGFSVRETSDGGYIALGYTRPNGNFETSDLWLLKTDSQGDTLWTQTYGGEFDDAGNCVCQTSDGGYIITGSTSSYSVDTTSQLWLIKTDEDGEEEWSERYSAPPGSWASGACVEETDDGGYIVTGSPTLMRTDSQGDTLWTRSYGSYGGLQGNYIEQTSDGGFIVTGEYNLTTVWMLKTDEFGDSLWFKSYNTMMWDAGECIRETPETGYIVAGWASDDIGGWSTGTQMWILRTDEFGDTVWSFLSAWEGADMAESVDLTDDGGYIVVGFRQAEDYGPEDLWLIKFDDEGDTVWTRIYDGEYPNVGYCVQQTEDGGYIITGYTSDDSSVDLWLIKTDDEGYAGEYEISPTTVVIPDTSASPPTVFTPQAYFTHLGDIEVGDFLCHSEIVSASPEDSTYHDTFQVTELLRLGDSVLVTFAEWTKGKADEYDVTFYTSQDVEGWHSDTLIVHLDYGVGASETKLTPPSLEIASIYNSGILIKYSGYLQGFHASIFDVSGRKVDELYAPTPSGTLAWGSNQPSGVYFVLPERTMENLEKVILVR